jgi:hypothetical protein
MGWRPIPGDTSGAERPTSLISRHHGKQSPTTNRLHLVLR